MVKFYHIDQAGAPALSYTTSATNVANWNSLVSVLKACLVSGYGAQAAAGWQLIFEDANNLVLRNGVSSGYVCFSNVAAGTFTISIAETFSGVSGGFIVGDGAKSGVATANSIPHRQCYRSFSYHINNCSWWILADEKTFIMSGASTTSTSDEELTAGAGAGYSIRAIYVGEDAGGNFIAIGGLNTTTTTSTINCTFIGGFTTLRDPATGLLVDSDSISTTMPGFFDGQMNFSGSLATLPDARLTPLVWEANGAANRLRGICLEPRISFYYMSTGAQKLGGAPLMSRTHYTPVDLGDGYNYVFCGKYYGYGNLLIGTDNPEFW